MTKAEMKARRRANRRLKRQEQHVERMAQERVAEIPYHNSERYADPTAYQAMLNIYRAERARSGKPGSTGSLARVEHYPSSSAALA